MRNPNQKTSQTPYLAGKAASRKEKGALQTFAEKNIFLKKSVIFFIEENSAFINNY